MLSPRSWVSRHARAAEALLVVVVVLCAAVALRQPSLAQRFTIDESRWISTSRYFWTTILERDVFGEAWQPNYIVLTQPPAARYLIGAGLWLQGWTAEELNGRWDSLQNRRWNEREGRVPSPELLAAARRVTLAFAIGCAALLYAIGRTLAGPVGGVAAVAFAVANPLLSTLWTRALAESCLAFFSLLALLLALRTVRRRPGAVPSAATGAAVGLATATKLSGVLGGLGLALFGVAHQASEWWRERRVSPSGVGPWLLLGLTAGAVFVAVNPLLYPDPVGRTVMLFEHRREEMRQQQRNWPSQAVPDDLGVRAGRVGRRVFGEHATLRPYSPLPLDAALVASGLAVAVLATLRDLVARRPLGPRTLLLCWVLAVYGGVTPNLGFESTHYYAPPLTINVVLEALALATALGWLLGRARSIRLPTIVGPTRSGQIVDAAAGTPEASSPFVAPKREGPV